MPCARRTPKSLRFVAGKPGSTSFGRSIVIVIVQQTPIGTPNALLPLIVDRSFLGVYQETVNVTVSEYASSCTCSLVVRYRFAAQHTVGDPHTQRGKAAVTLTSGDVTRHAYPSDVT